MHAEAPTYLVASCTERKRAVIPEGLHLRNLATAALSNRVDRWWERLEQTSAVARHPAVNLYGGEHWTYAQHSLEALRDRGQPAELWVASAGYGLVPASARLSPYSATFTSGSPDSVVQDASTGPTRIEQLQDWWAALARFTGPEWQAPRSLQRLATRDPRATLVIVAAPHYIRAMRIDLLAARSALLRPEQLILVSNQELLADPELAPNLIPVDERCQTVVGGTMLGLNARVAHRLLAEGHAGPLTAPRLRERYDSMVSDAEKPPKHNRERMDDKEVLSFLRTALQQDPKAGWTLLLRTLRGNGRACEQGRFRELHKQVRDEVADAGQQGLKLDRD